ncbi:oxidoreductase mmfh [Streptomyces inusitatus]|uniref:Oxidoreductase mmfh n=1 Tax=Streptomyces inusitatus TaxID=68221 RepID=A0A918V3L0_9ACTN|nr:acyl-CoA dehydrogenase family protein [Streptomyces inusitatus]GGZ59459.1 oxidoreductase mmfh [Streptomyces inusitatus]
MTHTAPPPTASAASAAPASQDTGAPGAPRGHDEALAAAHALAPLFAERAAEAEARRAVPHDTVRRLDAAGLLHVLTPREWGGLGLGFDTALLTTAALARGCASTGWLRAVLGGNTWAVAQLPERARREVFAAPDNRVALQLRIAGPPARKVAEGYLLRDLRGRFCSGIDHARWVLAGIPAPRTAGAEPEPHVMLIPVDDTEPVDDWRTSGLRATGSRSFTLSETVVPAHRALPLSGLDPALPTPYDRPPTPAYRMAFTTVGTLPLAGVLLGTARAAVDALLERGRVAAGADAPALLARTDAAEALLLTGLARLAASATPGGTARERAAVRRDIAWAGTDCRRIVNTVFEAAGSGAIYDTDPLQRIWRDANAAAQHPTFDLTRWGPPSLT